MFDQKTIEALGYYVYALVDPRTKKPFYIGKGKANRVFTHMECITDESFELNINEKFDIIREIQSIGQQVEHVVIRHGLSEEDAFVLESALIDFSRHFGIVISNEVVGHDTRLFGIMTCDEISRKYNAEPLTVLDDPAIIININRQYKPGKTEFYESTRTSWVISKKRRETVTYALSEYRGLIVEVFEITKWSPVETTDKKGQPKIRWAFDGNVAPDGIRNKYLNKSIRHTKKKGAANPIRFIL